MKTNFTHRKFYIVYIMLVIAIFISRKSFAQASSQFKFNSLPVLVSGTDKQVGSVYRFSNVATGTDALVYIVSATGGGAVDLLDDNDISKPEAFSPAIFIPANKTGLVEFRIDFVIAGTNTLQVQDSLDVTAIDIDGNSELKEIDELDLHGGTFAYAVANSEIAVTLAGTKYTGKNVRGIEYNSIDTSAKQVMYTVSNKNISSLIYICGAQNSSPAACNPSRQKSIYFKNFTYPPKGSLPIVMSYFNAVAENNAKVLLNWVTEMELNNEYYTIERSQDNKNYKGIAMLLGSLTTSGRKTYQYTDNLKGVDVSKTIYYRIKQTDLDGHSSYSPVRSVKLAQKQNMIQVNPNPIVDNITVKYMSEVSGTMNIRIVNANGQTVVSKTLGLTKGFNNTTVNNLGSLARGLYVVEVMINNELSEKTKLIKN